MARGAIAGIGKGIEELVGTRKIPRIHWIRFEINVEYVIKCPTQACGNDALIGFKDDVRHHRGAP